jgi:outer membrane protein insertion porin family
MYKVSRCFASDNPAKKTSLLHRCNLALLALLLSTSLLPGAQALQEPAESPVKRFEVLSYEGQKVSSVELAGQPDLKAADFMPLIEQRSGEGFSAAKIDQSIAALQGTGKFRDVQLDLRPEQEGVRVVFVLQPAVYFGTYQFSGAEGFPYTRLLQVANYSPQEPYSPVDIDKAERSIQTFLQRNGYFESEVHPEVHVDEATGLANVDFQIKLNRLAKFGDLVINGPAPDQTQHLKDILHSIRARLKGSAVREGRSYSLKAVEKATQYLEARLQSENRLAARVQLIGANYNAETNKADITYDVDIGPIVHGQVSGVRVWPWNRHKLLPIYQQNGLTPELIQEGRQNLLREFRQGGLFGGFRDVQVDTETKVEPNGVTVLYTVKQGPRKTIKDVAFTGNEHFDEEELGKHVVVKESSLLSKGSYNEGSIKTLQAFYQSKGFNEVKIAPEFNTKESDVVVTFAVKEGPQDTVGNFRIVGNKAMTVRQFAPDGLRLAAGQPYAQKAIDDDRNKIMSHYLDNGYLTATFHVVAHASSDDPHKFDVEYDITEGPQVKTNEILTVGHRISKQALIDTRLRDLKPGDPLTEREILSSETRLYNTGVFDWAEVNTRSQVTSQEQEDVIVKVHESKRNTITYGLGFEVINRGGSVPTGTVAVPGLPPVGLPSTFKTSQQNFMGPRFNFQYTRNNIRGRAETATFGGLYSPLDQRLSFLYQDPNFRWTRWTASFTTSGEYNKENPIFNSRQGQAGFQLQRPLDDKRTQNLFLRYTYTQSALTNLLIPELVPAQDLHTRLSTLAVVWIRDTRDNALDAHKGLYDSLELDLNPQILGSNVSFGKFLAQAAAYKPIGGIVWANSLRIGLEAATAGSHVPIGQQFFSGGGSTLRGFPLNGAGPQNSIPACGNPSDPSTCAFIRVPTGGRQLVILNSELRIPLPIKKGLSLVTFYDGGNVFGPVGFKNFAANYTNSVGLGLRYATPVGPIRVDVGRNLSPIPGISATQYFITLGQAF